MKKYKKRNLNYNKTNRLLEEIRESERALDTARSNFDNMTEPDLIDCYIYELNAAQTRYHYLLNQAKNYEFNLAQAVTFLSH